MIDCGACRSLDPRTAPHCVCQRQSRQWGGGVWRQRAHRGDGEASTTASQRPPFRLFLSQTGSRRGQQLLPVNLCVPPKHALRSCAGWRRVARGWSGLSGRPGVPHRTAAGIRWRSEGQRDLAVHLDRCRLRHSQGLRLRAPLLHTSDRSVSFAAPEAALCEPARKSRSHSGSCTATLVSAFCSFGRPLTMSPTPMEAMRPCGHHHM